jgi:hypothetical protein
MYAQLKGKASTRLFLVIMHMCRKRNALELTIYEKYMRESRGTGSGNAIQACSSFANYKQEEFAAN